MTLDTIVTDTGLGMPKEVTENLWKPLQTAKAKGMGMGLVICKCIIDAHGGDDKCTIYGLHGRGSGETN